MKKRSEIPDGVIKKLEELAEGFFDTAHDPDQMQVSEESGKKLEKLTPYFMNYILDDTGNPISWVLVMPTQKELVIKFVNREITEQEFLDESRPADYYTGFYICSMITLPEYQGKGLASRLIKETVDYIPLTIDALFAIWPTTPDGVAIIPKLEKVLGKEILIRN